MLCTGCMKRHTLSLAEGLHHYDHYGIDDVVHGVKGRTSFALIFGHGLGLPPERRKGHHVVSEARCLHRHPHWGRRNTAEARSKA